MNTPNAEQIRLWNEASGPTWAQLQDVLDAQLAEVGTRALDALAPAAGERILDVGCGCGATVLDLARRVGSTGSVVGIDVSRDMLARAAERVAAAGLSNVRLLEADAQTHPFQPRSADALFSRFGVMFFDDPRAAFANLRRAIVPGGRLAFVCWQALARNPIMRVPAAAAAQHIPLPPPPPEHGAGPFAFDDETWVRDVLGTAGWTRVTLDSLELDMGLGGSLDLDAATQFSMRIGPTAGALRQAPPEAAPIVASAIRAALAPYATASGVRMPAAFWIVRATNPDAG